MSSWIEYKTLRGRCYLSRLVSLMFCVLVSCYLAQAQSENAPLEFVSNHRVNAHGDEFNALARSPDGRFAFIGTEKGNLIVWNLASASIERTLHQPSPIHHLASLSEDYVVAVGSNHHAPFTPLVRKWNLRNETFEDLSGLTSDSFPIALASNEASQLIAVGLADGSIIAWDAGRNKLLARVRTDAVPIALAIVERQVYVSEVGRESMRTDREPNENVISLFNVDDSALPPKQFLRTPGRLWLELGSSPDHRMLVASFRAKDGSYHTVLIEPRSKLELTVFRGSAPAWINSGSFIEFDGLDPNEIVKLDQAGKISSELKLGRMQDDIDGRAFELTGKIANADGTKAWASYRKGPGFLEFDLKTNKIKTLLDGPSGAYGISVVIKDSNEGVLATGGADGYVRIWNLLDLVLVKEHHVAPPDSFVTDVNLLRDGRRAIVGVMRMTKSREDQYKQLIDVVLLDLNSGKQKKLFEISPWQGNVSVIDDLVMYPSFDRMKLVELETTQPIREFVVKKPIIKSMLSSNKKWLGILDDDKNLTVFEVVTGKQVSSKVLTTEDHGPMVITNDGRYIHQVAHEGTLLTWDMQGGAMTEHVLRRVQDMSTNVDFITLANDDKWLVSAGNHGDVGVFERTTGNLVCYEESGAAVFYAEKAWLAGDRLIFTTDTGVLFDGRLVKSTVH